MELPAADEDDGAPMLADVEPAGAAIAAPAAGPAAALAMPPEPLIDDAEPLAVADIADIEEGGVEVAVALAVEAAAVADEPIADADAAG